MARALLVGCGCRGREVGRALLGAGWAVRGTSRRPEGRAEIEAAGIDSAEADPDRVGTVVELLGDVTVVVWSFGSAAGSEDQVAAVHGPRLESTLNKLVDTPARGFVYEAAGTAGEGRFAEGRRLVEGAAARWRIPVRIVTQDPADWQASVNAITAAVEDVLRG